MGEQKRKRHEVVVTKALLLGYSFPETESGTIALYDPNGNEVMGCTHKAGKSFGPYFLRFPTRWMAADKALELAGVKPDAPVAR